MTRKRRLVLATVTAVAAFAVGAWLYSREPPPDTRWTGAYRLADGRLVLVTPREGKELRYRLLSGESSVLWPLADGSYEAGPGWAERRPVRVRVAFRGTPPAVTALRWWQDGQWQDGVRLPLPERIVTFASGDLILRGKLVTPPGSGPFPAVVIAHGSEKDSAVDYYFNPYLHAATGVACLVFDKRGTGGSTGRYTQYFPALAADVAAAIGWLRTQPQIDAERIHVAGFSQGGWVAPLAALRAGGVKSVLVGYGPAVPVVLEDRWGYVYALRHKGFGDDAIAATNRLSAITGAIFDRGENRWTELGEAIDKERARAWFATVQGSDSMIGEVTSTKAPLWGMRAYLAWMRWRQGDTPYIDRLYDPMTTLTKLDAPSLWILGGEDSSNPTGWTLEKLQELRAAGKRISWQVFPHAEHGIRTFVETPDGRRDLGLEPGYLPLMVRWLREQSGLPPQ